MLAIALLAAAYGTTPASASPAPTMDVTTTSAAAVGDAAGIRPSFDDSALVTFGAKKKVVPNVVGMKFQAAQKVMRAAGLRHLSGKKATGRGGIRLGDRGWVVVRQTPAAGKRVPADTRVMLYGKKVGE
ncbi:PASTA domain-containing protein [Thermopolyspora sp. NPDC052614]|uniref:PASTA domain-containing protein n=1 Tax=Thermopolyspora sp. NPDC052614 TaxID=3155682 RepID=UPI00342CCF47